jgi:hypothetical protein
VDAVRVAFGVCMAVAGAALVVRGLILALRNRRIAKAERPPLLGWEFWFGVSAAAAGAYLIMWPAEAADGETTATSEPWVLPDRVAFGLIGGVAVGAAIVLWFFADRITTRFGKNREPVDLDEELITDGPLVAASNAFWRRLGARRAAPVIAALGLVYLAGVIWPSVTNTMLDWFGVVEDIGTLLLLLVWFAFSVFCLVFGVRERRPAAFWCGAIFLAVLVVFSVILIR